MTHPKIDWRRLHDATLVALSAEWQSGEARIRVRLSEKHAVTAEVVVAGFTELRCPKEQPWGPSVSISEVRQLPITAGRSRLEIEMQSGDVIKIEGNHVELKLDV